MPHSFRRKSMEAQDTGKGALQPPPGKAASKHRDPPPPFTAGANQVIALGADVHLWVLCLLEGFRLPARRERV